MSVPIVTAWYAPPPLAPRVFSRHFTTTLVDDIASSAPANTPGVTGASYSPADTSPPASMHATIWREPPTTAAPTTERSFA
eukprot:200551-Chlamydomonas_euryale.AAC.1